MKRKKLPSVTSLRNKADRLMQEVGRKIGGNCESCSMPMEVMHHWIPKSESNTLRYEWKNLIPLCNKCHLGIHSKRSAEISGKIVLARGEDWYHEMIVKKRTILKCDRFFYQRYIDIFKTML